MSEEITDPLDPNYITDTVEKMTLRTQALAAQAAAEADTAVPPCVENWKLKAIIEGAGKTAEIATAIAALPDAVRIPVSAGWNNAALIKRDNQFLAAFIEDTSNTVDDATVDAWFLATKNFDD